MAELNGNPSNPAGLLEALNDGVYAVDRDRKIIYWNPAAEGITGWRAEDILGRRCCDNVLCHVDKEGRPLCGFEHCPLHRAMRTGRGSDVPIIVLALGRDGRRVPTRISVAPMRDPSGEVIGGVETFRDVSEEFQDAQTARRIQTALLRREVPWDARVSFSAHYLPWGMIGGDYYALTRVDEDRFAFMLADVCGHGLSAALYTIYLDAIWQSRLDLLPRPAKLAQVISEDLCQLIGEDTRFATAVLGLLDMKQARLLLTFAGGPAPLLFHRGGGLERLEGAGPPLGLDIGSEPEERAVEIRPGDCLLAFTDGVVEIADASGEFLGTDGLARVLDELGYPQSVDFGAIEERLLMLSDRIRFTDDLTFLEIRLT